MRVSRRGRGGRGRSRARSNGNEPYLVACGVGGATGGAIAKVGGGNCARGGSAKGAREAVSRALQGKAWACGGDQGRVRTALGRRHTHAAGAGVHRALLKVVVGKVEKVAGVAGRPGGPVRRRAAVRATEAAAATAATMAAAALVATAVVAASWAAMAAAARTTAARAAAGSRRRQWR